MPLGYYSLDNTSHLVISSRLIVSYRCRSSFASPSPLNGKSSGLMPCVYDTSWSFYLYLILRHLFSIFLVCFLEIKKNPSGMAVESSIFIYFLLLSLMSSQPLSWLS